MNFAGMIACTSSIAFGKLSYRCSHNETESWIFYSGSSHHMTFDITVLTNITYLPCPLLISLSNSYRVKLIKIGTVILAPDIILHQVLYVPSFKYNLVSIHCLSKSMPKSIVYFFESSCILQAPSMKRPLVICEAKDGLYFLCSKCMMKHVLPDAASTASTSDHLSRPNFFNSKPVFFLLTHVNIIHNLLCVLQSIKLLIFLLLLCLILAMM